MPSESSNPTVADLIERLTKIRERLFWLQSVWAVSLSPDVAFEADRYRDLFGDLADQLRKQDAEALDRLTAGHESLLFADASPKPTVPLAAQQLVELIGEVRNQRSHPRPPKPQDYALQNWP